LGGKYYSATTGDNVANVDFAGLGRASKVIVGQSKTIIIPSEEVNENLDTHFKALTESLDLKIDQEDIEFTKERLANISGGVGVIYVGANSDIEQKELKDRTDDAVLAVKAAIEEGVLPGGGIALLRAGSIIELGKSKSYDQAADIMLWAIEEPFRRILKNAGKDHIEVGVEICNSKSKYYGYDVKNDKFGDMMKMGVIDPTKVTRSALKNAVSVATTILSTNAIITNIRDDEGSR
jgi:chaperonin GroEL